MTQSKFKLNLNFLSVNWKRRWGQGAYPLETFRCRYRAGRGKSRKFERAPPLGKKPATPLLLIQLPFQHVPYFAAW